MTVTSPRPRERMISDYSGLLAKIKEEKLLARTIPFYALVFAGTTLVGLLAWAGTFALASSWWVLIPALILGICAAQYGFLAHEASHRQIFTSNKVNDWVGTILADAFVGLGYGWWMHKHNKHHANPNKVSRDPDIDINVLSFTPQSLASKKGVEKFFSKRQGALFPIFLLFTAFDMLFESYKALLNPKVRVKHRFVELALITGRVVTPITIAFLIMPWFIAVAFLMVMMMSLGLFMGGAFAPNHKGMPMIPKDMKVDFLRRQVLTSRNIKPGLLMDFFMGGLNYQVEHHLFPSMPRPHLKRAQQITEDYCRERGIAYTEVNLPTAYKSVVNYLTDVGLERNTIDPFDCPMLKMRYTT
ncbi:MAG: acyl-CoA desaturase [Enterococcus sp.]|nr:acyl-CoA desaturase [Enterococcus sp.]